MIELEVYAAGLAGLEPRFVGAIPGRSRPCSKTGLLSA
jgi:hypothetical protein